jgi:hypothetical protein
MFKSVIHVRAKLFLNGSRLYLATQENKRALIPDAATFWSGFTAE